MARFILLLFVLAFPVALSAQDVNRALTLAESAQTLAEQYRFAEAEPLYKQAMEIFERNRPGDDSDKAILLYNMGVFYEDQGRYKEAEGYYLRALEIREKRFGIDNYDTVQSLVSLGILYKDMGRYIESEPMYKEALKSKEVQTDDFVRAVVKNNLALLLSEQFRYDEAEPLYNEAIAIHEKNNNEVDKVSPLHNRARLYREQGRYVEAERDQNLALSIDERINGKDHDGTAISYNGLGVLYSEQPERYREAEPLLKKAITIYEKHYGKSHPYTADMMNDLAILYERQGRFDEALPLCNEAIAAFEKAGIAAHVKQLWYKTRASLYKHSNRHQEAVADLKTAMNLSLEVRGQASGTDEQRAQAFSRYYDLFERMVDWQHELGDMNEAYEAMERSRAQGLQDLINATGIDLLAKVPEAKKQKLIKDVADAQTALAAATERNDQQDVLSSAQKKLSDALAAQRNASPAFRQMLAEGREPVALDTVLKELVAEKTLALEYLIGAGKSYLLVYGLDTEPRLLPLELNEQQAELFGVEKGPLTAKKLETLLQKKDDGVLRLIGEGHNVTATGIPNAKTQDKLAALWMVLVPDEQIRAKILDPRAVSKLLILPDGGLAKFPFEALVVQPDAVNPQYLLDLGPATVYAPSASMYYYLKNHKTEAIKPQVLTLGNPDYERYKDFRPSVTLLAETNTRGLIWTPLLNTKNETQWIEDSCKSHDIPVIRFDSAESTEGNVWKNVSGKTIVHLACHGTTADEKGNPIIPLLALTVGDPNNLKDNGDLDIKEMFELELSVCELAILSACQTNLGPNQRGEGTWSMGRGMMASGAKRVVTSNWSVDDKSTSNLIFWFVKEMNEADAPDHAAALRQAKREIRLDQGNPTWKHPYFWAPFILIGAN